MHLKGAGVVRFMIPTVYNYTTKIAGTVADYEDRQH